MNTARVTCSRSTLIVAIAVCVALALTTAVFAKRARETRAELEAARAQLDSLKDINPQQPRRPSANANAIEAKLAKRDAEYERLRLDYEKLKTQLSSQEDAPQSAPRPLPAATPAANTNSWLERIRAENPERYRQIVESRELRRLQTDQWYQDTFDRLDRRVVIAKSQEEAELVHQIAETLALINELREGWRAIRELPEEQRQAQSQQLRAETREAHRTLSELRERDRTMQLENFARDIGQTDANTVRVFVDGIQQIYKNTEYNPSRAFTQGGQNP